MSLLLPWPPKELSPNARVHWSVRAKAAKKYRHDCYILAKAAKLKMPEGHALFSMTFRPPDNRRRDDDNMVAAFKSGRDGVAQALGADDYRFSLYIDVQESCPGGSVEVDITALELSDRPN